MGKKMSSKDKEAVSPDIEVGAFKFIMILRPLMPEQKGGFSAKRNQGWGTVELKCLEGGIVGSPSVTFRIGVGSPACTGTPFASPQVSHDFAQHSVRKVPHKWNFKGAADKKTDTFVVVLEVLARGACLSSGTASSSSAAAAAPQ